MKIEKPILICPLNWGLGHATRDIPIIRLLKEAGHRIVIATEPPLTQLLQKEFPDLEFEYFPGPKIRYSRKGIFLLPKLIGQIPNWIRWMLLEKKITKRLVAKHHPKCIISDNRYGVRNKKVKSILITHQLMLKLPEWCRIFEYPIHLIIKKLIQQFDQCWIPDNPQPNSLSGDLSFKFPLPKNRRFTGPLSDFMFDTIPTDQIALNAELLVILSGPEPQKTLLKKRIVQIIEALKIKTIIINGEPQNTSFPKIASSNSYLIQEVNHLSRQDLKDLILRTPHIISRAGYSTIMDLWYLNKKALLIPTPGQTEQLYLAKQNQIRHFFVLQNNLNLEKAKEYLNTPKRIESEATPGNRFLKNILQNNI